ncbi:uncharacterized protein BT62DRAFT_1058119 [Guyanagaster necrorhizus]|uniref:NADP-dependent oxidoreductase domain-containing protein n=1 Tax=Guyanagaster necrorhizus TaxID=856835 RepID=A0A9P7VEB0_9AGAR|nr:uncharacterized protein BT62DRAFT_1058119 [Guyanagaster necrorhizus MCA 3950]KAG7439336.1 hypothetical protein BT62DRAFT_1058119 [Guyanagaster necrorhizus MCA 3950]
MALLPPSILLPSTSPTANASRRVKAIGVSNFSIKTLEELFQTTTTTPAMNVIEQHPYFLQTDLIAYHKKGIATIPTGDNEQKQKDIINFPTLDEEDMVKINGLDRGERLCDNID